MKKDIWRIWIAGCCGAQMTINYHASEEDYNRFTVCTCPAGGKYEYSHTEGEEA